MNEDRNDLVSAIKATLQATPSQVAVPVPGIGADASAQERAARIAEIASKPGNQLTRDEAAYRASVRDASILATLDKSTDKIGVEEQTDLRAAVLKAMQDAAQKGWA